MRNLMTATALTAAMLASSAVYANEVHTDAATGETSVSAHATIGTLPSSGTVSIDGVVDSVTDEGRFVLRDSEGETIDVKTKEAMQLSAGDNVSVRGERSAKIAGLGREIEEASVNVYSDAEIAAAAHQQNNLHAAPAEARNNTEAPRTAAYDVDMDVNMRADADMEQVGEAGELTAAEASRIQAAQADAASRDTTSRDTTLTEDMRDAASNVADRVSDTVANVTSLGNEAVAGTIAALPKEGAVEVSGTVDRVRDDGSFVLRDADGKTIDVHANSALDVQAGDRVNVTGEMTSRMLGLNRKIEGAQVLELSASR